MKKLPIGFATTIALSLVLVGTAFAAPLRTFGTGTVTKDGNTYTIVNDAGEYAGVYVKPQRPVKNQRGSLLADADFSFSHSGDTTGGSPRFSIPVDEDGNGTTEAYAFIDANGCGNTGVVSTDASNCVVYYGASAYANWDAFAAAQPAYRISEAIPFVIADQAGTYVISDPVMSTH